jgi:long-subunit fatty acid transport protein
MIRQTPFIALALCLAAGAVPAQDVTVPPTLQFSISNPGARSMGFGGAFVALADDATAAFANPAGLVQITRPEISLEGRFWSYSTPYTERGRIEGDPTGIGVDVVAGLRGGTSSDDLTGVSFLSLVYPRQDWSIALYRHQSADFESFSQTQGLFAGGSTTCCRFTDDRVHTNLEVVSYGLSVAYRLTDALSLGLSLVYFDNNFDLVRQAYLPDEDDVLQIFAPTSYPPERMAWQTSLHIDDSDLGLTAGFLWTLSPRWRLGGFYREGPSFELRGESRSGPSGSYFDLPAAGTVIGQGTSPGAFPDVYGLGCVFRSEDGRLTFAFEWNRVEYSAILDRLDQNEFDTNDLDLNDGDEFHLGGEYVFLRSTPVVAARLGVWLDPDHRPRATAASELIERALLPPSADKIHWSLGIGLAFESFQIDLGADFSDLVDTVSLSAIYSF